MRTVVLTLLALGLGATAAPAQAWAEKMFKDGLTHDFGTVARGARLVHHFKITNIYAVRMEITSIKPGCGCVTATAPKRVLEPRETTTLEVRMDTGRIPAGKKTVGVSVSVGPEFISSANVQVTANSRADIVFNPGQVNFGSVTQGQAPTQAIDVEYAGGLNWQVSEVVARDVPFTVTKKEIQRRQSSPGIFQIGYRLQVTLNKDAAQGPHRHTIYLKTNDTVTPLVPLLVEASVMPAVTVKPATLNLGTVATGTAQIRRVIVSGMRPFHVESVSGTGSGVELGAVLSDRDAIAQFVTFKCQPGTAGPFKKELKIKTSLQSEPVVVTIEGVAAAAAPSQP